MECVRLASVPARKKAKDRVVTRENAKFDVSDVGLIFPAGNSEGDISSSKSF